MTTSKFDLKVHPDRVHRCEDNIAKLSKMIELKGPRSPEGLIRIRRKLMLIHSYIYYKVGASAISDDVWQRWAYDLVVLQDSFPHLCNIDYYDEAFVDWDGSTGMDLPYDDTIVAEAVKEYRMYTGQVLDVV
ncbi:putative NAD-dependent DNA ligase [Erwinia phage vB_EamM_Phobos]|uniref:DNA ligase n=1 Tax=Erwinia phage vB_EamM_Phobos TaxID=1883377 RepID=UPI00081CA3F2|nr:DNA ligase [Erwinia phage vB_EamM_Phobos]ANZ50296.1 putative NAD-dependent DNA ligase [Erwinia phage vB_EamM_Phobos]